MLSPLQTIDGAAAAPVRSDTASGPSRSSRGRRRRRRGRTTTVPPLQSPPTLPNQASSSVGPAAVSSIEGAAPDDADQHSPLQNLLRSASVSTASSSASSVVLNECHGSGSENATTHVSLPPSVVVVVVSRPIHICHDEMTSWFVTSSPETTSSDGSDGGGDVSSSSYSPYAAAVPPIPIVVASAADIPDDDDPIPIRTLEYSTPWRIHTPTTTTTRPGDDHYYQPSRFVTLDALQRGVPTSVFSLDADPARLDRERRRHYPILSCLYEPRRMRAPVVLSMVMFRDDNFRGLQRTVWNRYQLVQWGEHVAPPPPLLETTPPPPPPTLSSWRGPNKVLLYRSIRFEPPVCVYLFARFDRFDRFFMIPLLLRRPVADMDRYIRRHIQYSSVYNPYGSGAYTHWDEYDVRYYAAWTVADSALVLLNS